VGSLDWLMRPHPASYPSLWLASRPGTCAFRHIDSIFLVFLSSASAADAPSSHTLVPCAWGSSQASQPWETKCREYTSRVGRAASKENSTNRAACYSGGKMGVAILHSLPLSLARNHRQAL
jgi:hypothetical protein